MAEPDKPELVVCETTAANITHFRVVTEEAPIKLGGHPFPAPTTLCLMRVGWDTKIPVDYGCGCGMCLDLAKELGWSPT